MNFNGYLTAVTCGYSIVSPIVPISKLNRSEERRVGKECL